MPIIFINLNGFTERYSVFKMEENHEEEFLGRFTLYELPAAIPSLCHQFNCQKVVIKGINTFAHGIKRSIDQANENQYSNSIEIEVI